ncbi:unnamed protein product [Caenorhabditis sp. 36 PRJEB53466]|nr:unnamed protein product [Caenorhabditis sp. 36 PRJEB53466]
MEDSIGDIPQLSQLRIRATSYSCDSRYTGAVSTHFTSDDTVCVLNDRTGQSVLVASSQSTRDALASLVQRETEVERMELAAKQAWQQAQGRGEKASSNESRPRSFSAMRSRPQQVAQPKKYRARHHRSLAHLDPMTLTAEEAQTMLFTYFSFTQQEITGFGDVLEIDEQYIAPFLDKAQSVMSPSGRSSTSSAPRPTSAMATAIVTETDQPVVPLESEMANDGLLAPKNEELDPEAVPRRSRSHFGMSRFLDRQSSEPPPRPAGRSSSSGTSRNARKSVCEAAGGSPLSSELCTSNTTNGPESYPLVESKRGGNVSEGVNGSPADVVAPVPNKIIPSVAQDPLCHANVIDAPAQNEIREAVKARQIDERNETSFLVDMNRRQIGEGIHQSDEDLIAFLKEPLALLKAKEQEESQRKMTEPAPKRKTRARSSATAANAAQSVPSDADSVRRRTAVPRGTGQTNDSRSKSMPSCSHAPHFCNYSPPDTKFKHTTVKLAGNGQPYRNFVRLDMPLGQALADLPIGAVAGQLRAQKALTGKPDRGKNNEATSSELARIADLFDSSAQPQAQQILIQAPVQMSFMLPPSAPPPAKKRAPSRRKPAKEAATADGVPQDEQPKRKRAPPKKAQATENWNTGQMVQYQQNPVNGNQPVVQQSDGTAFHQQAYSNYNNTMNQMVGYPQHAATSTDGSLGYGFGEGGNGESSSQSSSQYSSQSASQDASYYSSFNHSMKPNGQPPKKVVTPKKSLASMLPPLSGATGKAAQQTIDIEPTLFIQPMPVVQPSTGMQPTNVIQSTSDIQPTSTIPKKKVVAITDLNHVPDHILIKDDEPTQSANTENPVPTQNNDGYTGGQVEGLNHDPTQYAENTANSANSVASIDGSMQYAPLSIESHISKNSLESYAPSSHHSSMPQTPISNPNDGSFYKTQPVANNSQMSFSMNHGHTHSEQANQQYPVEAYSQQYHFPLEYSQYNMDLQVDQQSVMPTSQTTSYVPEANAPSNKDNTQPMPESAPLQVQSDSATFANGAVPSTGQTAVPSNNGNSMPINGQPTDPASTNPALSWSNNSPAPASQQMVAPQTKPSKKTQRRTASTSNSRRGSVVLSQYLPPPEEDQQMSISTCPEDCTKCTMDKTANSGQTFVQPQQQFLAPQVNGSNSLQVSRDQSTSNQQENVQTVQKIQNIGSNLLPPDAEQISFVQYLPNQISTMNQISTITQVHNGQSSSSQMNMQSGIGPGSASQNVMLKPASRKRARPSKKKPAEAPMVISQEVILQQGIAQNNDAPGSGNPTSPDIVEMPQRDEPLKPEGDDPSSRENHVIEIINTVVDHVMELPIKIVREKVTLPPREASQQAVEQPSQMDPQLHHQQDPHQQSQQHSQSQPHPLIQQHQQQLQGQQSHQNQQEFRSLQKLQSAQQFLSPPAKRRKTEKRSQKQEKGSCQQEAPVPQADQLAQMQRVQEILNQHHQALNSLDARKQTGTSTYVVVQQGLPKPRSPRKASRPQALQPMQALVQTQPLPSHQQRLQSDATTQSPSSQRPDYIRIVNNVPTHSNEPNRQFEQMQQTWHGGQPFHLGQPQIAQMQLQQQFAVPSKPAKQSRPRNRKRPGPIDQRQLSSSQHAPMDLQQHAVVQVHSPNMQQNGSVQMDQETMIMQGQTAVIQHHMIQQQPHAGNQQQQQPQMQFQPSLGSTLQHPRVASLNPTVTSHQQLRIESPINQQSPIDAQNQQQQQGLAQHQMQSSMAHQQQQQGVVQHQTQSSMVQQQQNQQQQGMAQQQMQSSMVQQQQQPATYMQQQQSQPTFVAPQDPKLARLQQNMEIRRHLQMKVQRQAELGGQHTPLHDVIKRTSSKPRRHRSKTQQQQAADLELLKFQQQLAAGQPGVAIEVHEKSPIELMQEQRDLEELQQQQQLVQQQHQEQQLQQQQLQTNDQPQRLMVEENDQDNLVAMKNQQQNPALSSQQTPYPVHQQQQQLQQQQAQHQMQGQNQPMEGQQYVMVDGQMLLPNGHMPAAIIRYQELKERPMSEIQRQLEMPLQQSLSQKSQAPEQRAHGYQQRRTFAQRVKLSLPPPNSQAQPHAEVMNEPTVGQHLKKQQQTAAEAQRAAILAEKQLEKQLAMQGTAIKAAEMRQEAAGVPEAGQIKETVRVKGTGNNKKAKAVSTAQVAPQELENTALTTQAEEARILRIVKEKLASEEAERLAQLTSETEAENEANVAAESVPEGDSDPSAEQVAEDLPLKISAVARAKRIRETIAEIASLGPLSMREAFPSGENTPNEEERFHEYLEFVEAITKEMKEHPCVVEIGVEDVLANEELEPALHGRFRKRLAAIREGRVTYTEGKKIKIIPAALFAKKQAKKALESKTMQAVVVSSDSLSPPDSLQATQPSSESLSVITGSSTADTSPMTSALQTPAQQDVSTQQSTTATPAMTPISDLCFEMYQKEPILDERTLLDAAMPLSIDDSMDFDQSTLALAPVSRKTSVTGATMGWDSPLTEQFGLTGKSNDWVGASDPTSPTGPSSSSNYTSARNNRQISYNSVLDEFEKFTHNKSPPADNDPMMPVVSRDDDDFSLLNLNPLRSDFDFDKEMNAFSGLNDPFMGITDDSHRHSVFDAPESFCNNFIDLDARNNERPSTPSVGILDDSSYPSIDPSFFGFGSPPNSPMVHHLDYPVQNDTVTSSSDVESDGHNITLNVIAAESEPIHLELQQASADLFATNNTDWTMIDLLHHVAEKKTPESSKKSEKAPKLTRTNYKSIVKEHGVEMRATDQLQYKTTRKRGNDFLSPKEGSISGFHLMDQLHENGQSSSSAQHLTVRDIVTQHVTAEHLASSDEPAAMAEVLEKLEEERSYLMTKGEHERQLLPSAQKVEHEQLEPLPRRGYIQWKSSAGYGELITSEKKSNRSNSLSISSEGSSSLSNPTESDLLEVFDKL